MVARILSSAIALGSMSALTNLLGPEYGDYAYAVAWLTTLVLVGRFGFNKSATRYLAAYRGLQDWPHTRGFLRYSQRTMYAVAIGITLLAGALLLVAKPYIVNYYGDDAFYNCMVIALVSLPFLSHLEIVEGILDGFKRVVVSQIPMRMLRPAIIAGSVIVLFYMTSLGRVSHGEKGVFLTSETAMFVNLGAVFIALGLGIVFVVSTLPDQIRKARPAYKKREWFGTSRDMMLTSGFNLLLVQADVIMLGLLVDTDAVGLYTVASRIALLLILGLTAVNAILQPITADLYAQQKNQELQRIVTLGANAVFAISLIGSLVLYFGADYLHLIFGDEFVDSSPLLRILIIGQLFNAFAGPAVLLLNMTGYQRDSAKIMAGGAVLNLLLNAGLISWIGIEGAAYATAITTILWNLAAAVVVWYRLGIRSIALTPARKSVQ